MEQGMFDTTNLMMYDYRYFRRDWWNVPESCQNEPQDVKQLKDFASSIGVSREDIDLLLSLWLFRRGNRRNAVRARCNRGSLVRNSERVRIRLLR